MTRQLKPQVVDEVTSPNGHVKLPVFFDRNDKDFYVEVTGPEDRVRADSVVEVKKLARELLAKVTEYKWEAIIAIEMGQSYDEKHKSPGSASYRGLRLGAIVDFEFYRMERSKHPTQTNRFVYRRHIVDFEENDPQDYDRKRRAENRDLLQWGVGHEATVLPYDDETWQGLLAMKKAVDAAQAQLETLVERKDLADKLRLVGRQAIPPMLPMAVGSERSR